jgi:hypothetical protein
MPGISSQAAQLKTQNMSQLLGVFITPYDIDSLCDYYPILKVIHISVNSLEDMAVKVL